LFQILGMVHPRLRTGMLPRELVNKRNRTLEVRIGHVLPYARLAGLSDDRALMDYLRGRTYHLRRRTAAQDQVVRRRAFPIRLLEPRQEEVAPPESVDRLSDEVASLSPDARLLQNGPFDVYVAEAEQIPHLLLEIGRLREFTFRGVNEGTGRARDLDRFDEYYLHLFVWNREKREVVGAYRLGRTDLIVKRLGLRGLYTSTLFHYRKKLLDRINPALEMGRSFVRPEYQKNFSSLLLLWKGLACFVANYPQYRNLFGPVSISSDYQTSSRLLLVAFLKASSFLPGLARLVRPRKPLRANPLTQHSLRKTSAVVRDLSEVESLIADLETDLKGIPVLLRQYLRLGGKLLAFNVDPAFSNVLDGLILVDLVQTEPTLLAKYMGAEEAAKFRAYHEAKDRISEELKRT
jgi:putative hemolysin